MSLSPETLNGAFSRMFLTMGILNVSYVLFFAFVGAWVNLVGPVIFTIFLCQAWIFIRNSKFVQAGWLISLGMLFAPSWCVWFSGGPSSPLITWVLHGPVLAGVLISWRAAAIVSFISIINVTSVTFASIDFDAMDELYFSSTVHDVFFLMATSTSIIFMCIYVYIVIVEMQKVSYNLNLARLEMEKLSITDPLTGVFNRLKIDQELDREFAMYLRYQQPLSLIILDVDYFKSINDTYGHQVGDRVLILITEIVRDNCRVNDIFGRWGGEEFIIICPNTDITGAATLAEKIRLAIEAYPFPEVGHKTASFGVAECDKTESVQALITSADNALYKAKRMDRNRIVSA